MTREYTLKEIQDKAFEFLEDAYDSNHTTFKNYRISVNYFLYIMNCNKHRYATINDDNKDKALTKFKNCLSNGFTYEVESVDDVLGYSEEIFEDVNKNFKFKPIKRTVKINANGVNTHLRRIKTFFNQYLHFKIKNFRFCKVDKPKYKALKKDHVELLINECSNYWSNKEIATRNATLIRLLFNTALRVSEALGVTIDDTNFIDYDYETNKPILKSNLNKYKFIVHLKGRKRQDDEIEITEDMAKGIVDYINIKKVPSDYIFSTTRASADGKAKPLSRQWFGNDIIKLAEFVDEHNDTKTPKGEMKQDEVYVYDNISEVVENNSSHFLRHSRAVHALSVLKLDIRVVQKMMRHDSLESTLIYTEINDKAVANIAKKYSI